MKLLWLTDIHVNFLNAHKRESFYSSLRLSKRPDVVVISGDIAESDSWMPVVYDIHRYTQIPVYFVLGNHDYYGSSISKERNRARRLSHPDVKYLPANPSRFSNGVVIVGADGWGDTRSGDFGSGRVRLNDENYIEELRNASKHGREALGKAMREIARRDTLKLSKQIVEALKRPAAKTIVVVTHVPPWAEASRYQGKISGENFRPFFVNQQLGQVLKLFALTNPKVRFIVLAGHTHGEYYKKMAENLEVYVGGAEYFYPKIANIIEV